MTITPADLERRLWNALNALHGPVGPADFKAYVFPTLFWKWISDTWDYEHKQAVEQWGEAVYDPTSGSGGMLIDTINWVRQNGGDRAP